jgi:hypothetical protein
MSDAPTRLWVTHLEDQVGPREAYTHAGSWPGSRTEYILATPAALSDHPAVKQMVAEAVAAERAADRKAFPILKGGGAKIDYQLVADHAEQAKANHYQTVERLAERGGLSWCELYAVLHNRKWEKIETNEAIIACRNLEARYLAAISKGETT